MLEKFRQQWSRLITPVARGLIKLGLNADIVTWTGTIVSCLIAIVCFPQGWLWQGVLAISLFLIMDSLDGTIARLQGAPGSWGAFLDSTLDRITDGVVFGSLAMFYVVEGEPVIASVGILALIFGQVTSYSKARGESLGATVKEGIAGRADRLVLAMLGALLTGLGVNWALPLALTVLFVLGVVTVVQRMLIVQRQLKTGTADAQ